MRVRDITMLYWAPEGMSYDGDGTAMDGPMADDDGGDEGEIEWGGGDDDDDGEGDDDAGDDEGDSEKKGAPSKKAKAKAPVQTPVVDDSGDNEGDDDDDTEGDDDLDDDELKAFRDKREQLRQRREQQRQQQQPPQQQVQGIDPNQLAQQFRMNPMQAINQLGIPAHEAQQLLMGAPVQQAAYDEFGQPIPQPDPKLNYLEQQIQQQQQVMQQMVQQYQAQQQQTMHQQRLTTAQLMLTNFVKDMPLLGLHGEQTAQVLSRRMEEMEELYGGQIPPREAAMIARDLDDQIYETEANYLRQLAEIGVFADAIDVAKLGRRGTKGKKSGGKTSRGTAGKAKGGKAPRSKDPADMTDDEREAYAWRMADLARAEAEKKGRG